VTARAIVHDAPIMRTYARLPVTLVRGEGVRVWDDVGAMYLDFVGGLGALSLGHAHPRWVDAIDRAARTIGLTSNLVTTRPQAELAERITSLLPVPDGRVFFCNSGAEANEAAIKLIRKWGLAHGRTAIVALEGSFHGRTVAALAATGQPAKRAPFEPLLDWFRFVPPGDHDALEGALRTNDVAAVLLEPVLGEGGVVPLSDEYLRAVRKGCDDRGALLVVDEVQAGCGRCGDWLSITHAGVVPDVVTIAKALGGGLPIGALVARADISFAAGEHASTFGGGPVPCAASLAVLQTIDEDDLLANVRAAGSQLRAGIRAKAPEATLRDVRGRGLLTGLETAPGVGADVVVSALLRRGVVSSTAGPDTVRFTPPFTVTSDEIDAVVDATVSALIEVAA
jgi:acetylornithine aminotransferase